MTAAEAKEIVRREYPKAQCRNLTEWWRLSNPPPRYQVFLDAGRRCWSGWPVKSTHGAAWKAAAEAILAQKGK